MKIEGPEELLQFMELMDVIQAIRDAMRQYFRNKIREYNFDITFEMIEVLIVLWKEDGRNQQEIADAVRKNKASLTSLIDNLSTRKLVARSPDPNDRRNNIISLTREGIAYQARVTPLIREFYETFQQDFPDLELDQINKLLGRFYEQIQEKGNNA